MDVVENPAQKALLAEALLAENEPPSADAVIGAIVSLQQRKDRGGTAGIAGADPGSREAG